MKTRLLLSLILFSLIIGFLWRGLSLRPTEVNSPLINKTTPLFQLPELFNPEKIVSNNDFLGHVTLFNVWATWCYACAHEHAFLLQLANHKDIVLLGLNYKDDPVKAQLWLTQYGNPYQLVAVDRIGNIAIDWGVYGTPETFVIDKKGMIRHKHIGPITLDNWEHELKPIITQLQKERV